MDVAGFQYYPNSVSILLLLNQLELFETLRSRSMDLELVLASLLPYQLDMAVQCTDSLAAFELLQLTGNMVVQTASAGILERVEQTALPVTVGFQEPVAFAESAD